MRFFEENGLACRLIGHAERHFGTISAAVEPMLFGADAGEARVYECGNMMSLCAAHMGGQSFLGAGAGAYPTGSNVLADCRAIAEGCSGLLYGFVHPVRRWIIPAHISGIISVGRAARP